jgi:hypothetical protein
MKRLEINGQYADLSSDSIGINWQYLDITNPGNRYTPFSSTITLPFTGRNKQILGYGDAIGANMTKIRSLPNVNLWFGHNKIITNGTLKVTSISAKGYVCSVTGRNSVIETIEAHTMTEVFDEAVTNGFNAQSSLPNAIASLEVGYSPTNWGWILPRTMPDALQGASWEIWNTTTGYAHEVWLSAAGIIRAIESLGWFTLKIWKDGRFVSWSASEMSEDLNKLYTPCWNYHLNNTSTTWDIIKVATGTRIINGKSIDKSTFVNFGGGTPWDFVRVIAQLFCAMIYQDGTNINLIPLNNMTADDAIDLTGKVAAYVKNVNIPGYESSNYVNYKITDNLPSYFGRTTITAPVVPVTEKDLFTLDLMLPGLYVATGFIFNSDYGSNGDLAKSPLFLYDDGTTEIRSIIYDHSPSDYSDVAILKQLSYFDFSGWYSNLQIMATDGIFLDADIDINPYDLLKLLPTKMVKVNNLGGLFYLNKITNYDPYSGKLAKCQIVKLNAPFIYVDDTDVTLDSIDTISDGLFYSSLIPTVNYTNTGNAKDLTIIWEVGYYALGEWQIISTGSNVITFNNGSDSINLTGITYPDDGTGLILKVTLPTGSIESNEFESISVVLNHIDTIGIQYTHIGDFTPAVSFEAVCSNNITVRIYYIILSSTYVELASGYQDLALLSGTNTKSFGAIGVPSTLGTNNTFHIGLSTSYSAISNNFEIAF